MSAPRHRRRQLEDEDAIDAELRRRRRFTPGGATRDAASGTAGDVGASWRALANEVGRQALIALALFLILKLLFRR